MEDLGSVIHKHVHYYSQMEEFQFSSNAFL